MEGLKAACSTSGVVVGGLAVEGEAADGDEGVVGVGPDFGEVEGIVGEVFHLGFLHDLDLEGPGGEVAFLDGVEEVTLGVVGIGSCEGIGLRRSLGS